MPSLTISVQHLLYLLILSQEVTPTFESLTPIELIQTLAVDQPGRPRRTAAANAQIPGFYRYSTNTPQNPHDDIYGCNMHFAKAASDYGHELATFYGSLKAVTPVCTLIALFRRTACRVTLNCVLQSEGAHSCRTCSC
jgi:hypothetical protein